MKLNYLTRGIVFVCLFSLGWKDNWRSDKTSGSSSHFSSRSNGIKKGYTNFDESSIYKPPKYLQWPFINPSPYHRWRRTTRIQYWIKWKNSHFWTKQLFLWPSPSSQLYWCSCPFPSYRHLAGMMTYFRVIFSITFVCLKVYLGNGHSIISCFNNFKSI